jgi:C-terminal processing protease CtpA/Prc
MLKLAIIEIRIMKHSLFTLLISLITIGAYCQTKEGFQANFDFEKRENGLPLGWNVFGAPGYTISLDSSFVRNGKYSASIQLKEGSPQFKALAFTIPTNYEGKKITLSGYIKTEDVTEGYAGLWMRIDPAGAYTDMSKNGVKGTSDWKRYEITLDLNPLKTKGIVIGGMLAGTGKMWLDDFKVSIDGKDISSLKPYQRKLFPAEKDGEFDKGSQISLSSPDESTVDNLRSLGLVWGFLKYYHPNVASGNHNWDYELFRILPEIVSAKNLKERDAALVIWINKLGEFETETGTKKEAADVKIKPDLDWISNSKFSDQLIKTLLKVKNAKRSNEHYYIGLHDGVQNPEFKNENAYASSKYPDTGFRLLSLYRYWNMIQYFFPYKNLIEEDWKGVLEEFIPKFIDAKNETEYTLTTLALIARIHDTHANIWGNNQALKNYIGVNYSALEIGFVENKALVIGFLNESGAKSGLKVGDIITKVNDKPVETIVRERLKITPASNYSTQLRNLAPNLLRTNDTTVRVEFISNGVGSKKIISTYSADKIKSSQRPDTCFSFIEPNIGYLYLGKIKKDYLLGIFKNVKETEGLIIDLRCYPSEFVVFSLGEYLMPRPTEFVKFSNGNIRSPGLFTITPPLKVGRSNSDYYKGKIVILINELTQSQAEYTAMAFRVAPNVTVIGSETAGADGNVSQISLPGGITSMISGIGVYTPQGKETQRIGIVPDIEIKPTIDGIKNGKDELMERAIKIIRDFKQNTKSDD